MYTLILDTSGRRTTVAIAEIPAVGSRHEPRLCDSRSLDVQPLTHLHEMARDLLAGLDLSMRDLGAVAVVAGPGSWTGLNIGVTAAKTLAQVLAIPVIPLGSLDCLVADSLVADSLVTDSLVTERQLPEAEAPTSIFALLDAKRRKVYCGVYRLDGAGAVDLGTRQLEVLPFDEVVQRLRADAAIGKPLVVEYGQVVASQIEQEVEGVRVSSVEHLDPRGLLAALLAARDQGLTGEAALTFSPHYLQDALGG